MIALFIKRNIKKNIETKTKNKMKKIIIILALLFAFNQLSAQTYIGTNMNVTYTFTDSILKIDNGQAIKILKVKQTKSSEYVDIYETVYDGNNVQYGVTKVNKKRPIILVTVYNTFTHKTNEMFIYTKIPKENGN